MMDWFYALNGQQAGPVSEEELAVLFRNGTISAHTLVWRSGLSAWAPLATVLPDLVRGISSDAPATADAAVLPPVSAAAPGSDNWISEQELLAGDYPVDIGGCISKGWETFFKNPWTLLGGSLLAWVILVAASLVPILGFLAQFVLYGPLVGGVFVFYLTQIRTGSTDVGVVFSAFGPRFIQHMLVYLVQMLITFALTLPLLVAVFTAVMGLGLAGQNRTDLDQIWAAVGVGSVVMVSVVGLAVWAAIMALTILWFFAVPLVADKGYDFWPALQLSRKVVAKHFWWTLLFFIAIWAISMLGAFACLVGMLVSIPVAFAAMTHWYENVFGRLRPKSSI